MPVIALEFDVFIHGNSSYGIETEEHGTLYFYPKGNRLQFAKDNTWKSGGLNWINKNLTKLK